MRTRLLRHDRVVLYMSGGLDSAIVARFAAEERRPGQHLLALTAAAPPGSTRRDERDLAADIAAAFGLEHRLVWPDETARLFRPAANLFGDGELALSPRHYLYETLAQAARDFGATAVLDGAGGEAAVSRHDDGLDIASHGRAWLRWLRGRYRHRIAARSEWADSYQVMLAPDLRAMLPPAFAAKRPPDRPPLRPRSVDDPMGFQPLHESQWRHPTIVAGGGIRRLRPLRDRRLIALAAGMPASFTRRGDQDRALARAMLEGHVPERVHRQPKGLAFSVDYADRFDAELPGVLKRLPDWRDAGVDAWLDLDRLERDVRRAIHAGGGAVDRFQVQFTALAAEYFLAWHGRRGRPAETRR